MEVPKEVKDLYSLLNDEQIEYIRSKYYYSILERLEEWKLKFENNQKEDAVIVARIIKRNGYLEREININQDIRFYISLVLFFDYHQLLQSYKAKEYQDKPTYAL